MKAFIAIVLSLFLYTSTYAQDPQLFENTWYLQKVVIDGETFFPPHNSEVSNVRLEIWEDHFDTVVCAILFGEISNVDNTSITAFAIGATLLDCNLQVNYIFEGIYFGFYGNLPVQTFQYTIQPGANDDLLLTLTNDEGDLTYFGDVVILSIREINNLDVSIYPNPVKDILNIDYDPSDEIQSVDVYSLLGELVKKKEHDINQLDLSSLNSGVYFLKIETVQGMLTKKIIKN